MPTVSFTQNIQRHVACPTMEVDGATVGEALDAVSESIPRARGYVLDERGAIRRHMGIFVDGEGVSDRKGLSDSVRAGSEI